MVTPNQLSKLMHDIIPNSKLVEINGMHGTPKEKAPEVNKYILDFLK